MNGSRKSPLLNGAVGAVRGAMAIAALALCLPALPALPAMPAMPAMTQPAFRVADINTVSPGSTWVWPYGMEVAEAAGRVFFGVSDGLHGTELWATDGTAAFTALVKDICPGVCGASPFGFAAVGGVLFFSADDGARGRELWVSDGTAAGTRLVTDLRPGLQARGRTASPSSAAGCCSPPTTASSARSCGRATALPRGPSWWRISPLEPRAPCPPSGSASAPG